MLNAKRTVAMFVNELQLATEVGKAEQRGKPLEMCILE
jgi:hypothetical protein